MQLPRGVTLVQVASRTTRTVVDQSVDLYGKCASCQYC